jgi:hypothetical protein
LNAAMNPIMTDNAQRMFWMGFIFHFPEFPSASQKGVITHALSQALVCLPRTLSARPVTGVLQHSWVLGNYEFRERQQPKPLIVLFKI